MKIRQLSAFLLLYLLLPGCSMSPNQQYRLAAFAYNDIVVVAAGAHVAAVATGKSSPQLWQKIQTAEAAAAGDLRDAYQWLRDNPTLADVPGLALPPLNPFNLVLSQIHLDVLGLNLVPSLPPTPPAPPPPPASAPTTPPATTSTRWPERWVLGPPLPSTP